MSAHKRFYQRPKTQVVLVFIGGLGLYAYLTYRLGGLQANLLAILFDGFLLVVGLLFWAAFFSQFVLPVRTLGERWQAFNRLLSYVLGSHGPAIFIENGQVVQRSMEMQRSGQGVIFLDTASAAVLRNPLAFTRPVGPGIVFTQRGEYLAGTVDLHFQEKRLGPLDHDDPFAERASDESLEAYQRRQQRRWETSGLTRDGVEVIPNIAVTFRLDSKFGEGGTMFGYNPKAVWQAIASEGIDPNAPPDARSRHVRWDWLPVHMAADLWREYLRKFTLNQLFAESHPHTDHAAPDQRLTVYEWIEALVFERLTQPEVDLLNEIGRPAGKKAPSREHAILQDRGIRIHRVSITNLRFPASVEKELVRQWKATWLERAQKESELVERRRSFEKLAGEEAGLVEFATAASQYLGPIVIENANMPELLPDLNDSLELMVRGSLNQCIRDPELAPKLTTEKTHLVELVEWIRRQ